MYSKSLQFLLILLFNSLLQCLDQLLNFSSKFLHLFFKPSHFLYFLKIINSHNLLTKPIKQMHLRILLLPLLLLLLFLFRLLDLQLHQKLPLILGLKLLIKLPNFLPPLLINKNIIKISQIWQLWNQMIFVLAIFHAVFHCEGVAVYV